MRPHRPLTDRVLAEFARRHTADPHRKHTTDQIAAATGAPINSIRSVCTHFANDGLLHRTPRNGSYRLYWISAAGLDRVRLGDAEARRASMVDACAALARALGYRVASAPTVTSARRVSFATPGDIA